MDVSEGPGGKNQFTRDAYRACQLTSWYLMGKSTKRWGFSWSRGSLASISLIAAATEEASAGFSATGLVAGTSTAGADEGVFSLPADSKLSFLTGESFILRFSKEEAAYEKMLC